MCPDCGSCGQRQEHAEPDSRELCRQVRPTPSSQHFYQPVGDEQLRAQEWLDTHICRFGCQPRHKQQQSARLHLSNFRCGSRCEKECGCRNILIFV